MLADRAEAVKLPIVERLLGQEFQSSQPEKVFVVWQTGTFNEAKTPQLRNAWVGATSLDEVRAAI